ncbi:synaptotagmin-15-like isoform X3 [Ornithodoros turicata]|uniref:synaptotagmin-15-like isoform X3 n=1 Tax=Ornithodoros turicata TaxID=34597 RepID=UPI003139327E
MQRPSKSSESVRYSQAAQSETNVCAHCTTAQSPMPDEFHLFGDAGIYLWAIIGCGAGIAVLLIFLVALLLLLRRKTANGKKSSIRDTEQEQCRITQGAVRREYLRGRSNDAGLFGPLSQQGSRSPMAPGPDSMPGLSAEAVQPGPRSPFVRWNTFCAPDPSGSHNESMPFEDASYRFSDDEEDTVPPCTNGRLWFSVLYNDETEELFIRVIRARYLPGRGLTNAPRDPFIRAYLLPDEENFRQTQTKRRTLCPRYDETLTFKINLQEARLRTLRLSAYDIDRKKIRHCLGHVTYSLEGADLISNEEIEMDLENVPKKTSKIGEIHVCLTSNPFSNRVKVTSMKLRKLSLQKGTRVYVKVSLNHGRNVVKEKRTTERPAAPDIVAFSEAFSFGVAGKYLESCSLCFVIIAVTDAGDDVRLGKTALGPFMYARGDEHRHWQEMLSNPRSPISKWHALDPPSEPEQ